MGMEEGGGRREKGHLAGGLVEGVWQASGLAGQGSWASWAGPQIITEPIKRKRLCLLKNSFKFTRRFLKRSRKELQSGEGQRHEIREFTSNGSTPGNRDVGAHIKGF